MLFLFKADFIIAIFHWGVEYTQLHDLSDEDQQIMKAITPYVSAIIGSHVHITRGHFYYKNRVVVPQIGNFLFPMHLTPHYVRVVLAYLCKL